MLTQFQYSPLSREKKEIRLLQFDSTDSLDGPIRAHIIRAPLNEKLVYFALSYTWGSSERTRSISLSATTFPSQKTSIKLSTPLELSSAIRKEKKISVIGISGSMLFLSIRMMLQNAITKSLA